MENRFRPSVRAKEHALQVRRNLSRKTPQTIGVVGAGGSGLAAGRLLKKRGYAPVFFDDQPRQLEGFDCQELTAKALEALDLVVLSPGVPRIRSEFSAAVDAGKVIGEIELASWFIDMPLIGITGTNGKSTTCALTAHLLQAGGKKVFLGGNFGQPLSEAAGASENFDFGVVELSSYQLESLVWAEFFAGVWLNLDDDHLDRYQDLADYGAAKARLIDRIGPGGTMVFNADQKCHRTYASVRAENTRWFCSQTAPCADGGTWLNHHGLLQRDSSEGSEFYRVDNPSLVGEHNLANAAAAIELCRLAQINAEDIQAGLSSFKGLSHRLELVGTIGKQSFYNDSKATNISAAVTAVKAMPGPTVLIVGGVDKGGSWHPLVEASERVSHVLAIGAAQALIQGAFGQSHQVELLSSLEEAVRRARHLSQEGEVLLAPACASFDQFKNYKERGDAFRKTVQTIMEGAE